MNHSHRQLNLLVASQVLEIAATLRQEAFARSGTHEIDDPREHARATAIWHSQHPIAGYTSSAIKLLQDVERQVAVLSAENS